MREVVTEKIFSGEEDLIQISTEDRLWDLVEKMKRLEKYIPCVINDVAVIGIDKEQELFLQEQCSNIAVNLHGSPLKVGSIDPYSLKMLSVFKKTACSLHIRVNTDMKSVH